MSQSVSVWLVIALAFCAANFPFVTTKVFGVLPLAQDKGLPARIGELVVLYFAIGAIGLLLEKRIGQIAPQEWEFYAVTGALFVTLAFPGFVWRYLIHHRSAA